VTFVRCEQAAGGGPGEVLAQLARKGWRIYHDLPRQRQIRSGWTTMGGRRR
jgi:hypothetical protein